MVAPGRGLVWQALAARTARDRISDGRVLGALQGLAAAHDDAGYRSEQGMLETALGGPARPGRLAALERRGLIRAVSHPPETTPHWQLTDAGHAEADARRTDREREREADR
jgi:manganese/zinc/iron transport system permease protein